jgi:hypothetical protein
MNMKTIIGILLIAHGLVHAALAAAPNPTDPEGQALAFFTVPERSWLFSRINLNPAAVKWIGLVLVGLATLGFILAGIGILTSGGLNTIWRASAAFSSIISLLLLITFWHRWLPIGILIDLLTLSVIISNKLPEL